MTKRPLCAILLIPALEDPLGLLQEGPCGARPPLAMKPDCEIHGAQWILGKEVPCCQNAGHSILMGNCVEALVLVWDGKPVREGCGKLEEAWMPYVAVRWIDQVLLEILQGTSRKSLGEDCPGTLVFLDAERREITP